MKKTKARNTMIAPSATEANTMNEWQCICCQGGEFRELGSLPSTDHAGELSSGQTYSRVHRQRVQCADCGQNAVRMIFVQD